MGAALANFGKTFAKNLGGMVVGRMGSGQKATFIVRSFRTVYGASALSIILIWYTAWRNERIAPGDSSFPWPSARLRAKFRPDRPNTDSDMGYEAKRPKAAVGSPGTLSVKGGGNPGPPDWGGCKAVAETIVQGLPLQNVSSKRSTQTTASGGTSDHWTGCRECYAIDNAGSVAQMDMSARQIMSRLGAHYSGGELVHTVEKNGYRIQILYRTMVGGNHFDHIHVGVRKVGYEP
jgi:hypothetical protein